jgi:hypothetical protein
MVNAGDIPVPQASRGARLPQEPGAGGLAVQMQRVDDLKCDIATQVCIERLIRDAHGAAAEFEKRSIRAPEHLVMLESFGFFNGRHGSADFPIAVLIRPWRIARQMGPVQRADLDRINRILQN